MTRESLASAPPATIVYSDDLAEALDCNRYSLKGMISSGSLPPCFKIGRKMAWLAGDLCEHFKQASQQAIKSANRFAEKVKRHSA